MTGNSGKGRGRIPPELLQKIKEAVNLVEVIGEHVVLRKTGASYSGLCPFHSERTPSFNVSETKQLYHCYGCKKSGDLVTFVMDMFGYGFPEAIEELAERARIALPTDWDASHSDDPEVQKRKAAAREKQSTAFRLTRFVAKFYHETLPRMPEAEQYFRKRGITAELNRDFYLGAAPSSWDALASFLAAKQAPLPLAVELGLIRPSQKSAPKSGPGYFDLFRNRAMFPILDLRGKVVGFGGRSLPSQDDEGPKYMNSPESFIYQKSKLAFGLFQAQKHIREKDEVILVEGYFDVLALHAAGFQNVIATCGTALTADHLQLFKRLASKVTILFDGDKAGVSATERAMEIGLDQGEILYGAVMPPDLDPDEVLFDQDSGTPLPDGLERMRAILGGARPLLDTRVEEAVREAATGPEARTQALKQIGRWLVRYKDPVGREVRAQAVQTQLGVDRRLLDQAMGVSSPAPTPKPAPQVGPRPVSAPRPTTSPVPRRPSPSKKIHRSERVLLKALAQPQIFLKHFIEIKVQLPPRQTLTDLFEHPWLRQLAEHLPLEAGNPSEVAAALQAQATSPSETPEEGQLRSVLMEALMGSPSATPADKPETTQAPVPEFADEFKAALMRAVARAWARFSQQIKSAIAAAESKKDAGLQAQLMKEYLDVQRKMKEFSSFYDEA